MIVLGAASVAWVGCAGAGRGGAGVAGGAAVAGVEPVELTLLYTSDEHGWVEPVTEKGRARGGAAELLARWVAREGHCVPTSGEACEGAATVALSGGDNWTGPAISSFFGGEVAADAMRRLGYAASALGNHELDFGRATFERNARAQGFPYVAANVTSAGASAGTRAGAGSGAGASDGVARPFVLVRRRGVTVGVVGLSTRETVKVGLRSNYEGLSFGDEEAALERSVPAAYDAGADVVVVVAHACAAELRHVVARHPAWRLGFVGAGHCHKTETYRVFDTPVVEPGSFLRQYARVSLRVDRTRPPRERVVSSEVTLVDLTRPEGEAAPVAPDAALSESVSVWKQRTERELGEVLGHSDARLEPDTAPLVNFLTDRWREATGADVAIMNRYGTRQAIERGPITRASIFSVLPFNNRLLTVRVTGELLRAAVTCCNGHVAGVRREAQGALVLDGGRPIDPKATYKVAVTDYIYLGGSGFAFEKQDPSPVDHGDWREPLIAWLKSHPTAPGKGLETLIDAQPRLGKH